MTELLQWTTMQINRRMFLKRTLGGAFALYAGAAVRAPIAVAGSCTGPNGAGPCASYNCAGSVCTNGQGVSCTYVTGFCDEDACWTSGTTTCCDCFCHVDPSIHWYCYCASG